MRISQYHIDKCRQFNKSLGACAMKGKTFWVVALAVVAGGGVLLGSSTRPN